MGLEMREPVLAPEKLVAHRIGRCAEDAEATRIRQSRSGVTANSAAALGVGAR